MSSEKIRTGDPTYSNPFFNLENKPLPISIDKEYCELGRKKHPLGEKEPLSKRLLENRGVFPVIISVVLSICGLSGFQAGKLEKINEQKKEELRVLILEKLSNKTTQKEGMQMINNLLSNVDKKIVEELFTATKGEQLSNLAIATLLNIANEKQIAKEGEVKIKEHIQIKKEVIFYFLNVLDIENEKNINKNDEKEKYRNNKYKDKLRDAIKTICNPTSKNVTISMNNFFNIMELSRDCSDTDLKDWATGQLELLKEKNDPIILKNQKHLDKNE
ncbi:hypothetical protein KKC67_01650 [Patescibacteria group bacterium]|nr:hypothetical protein [Patescibacteria group bacterium]MBU0879770.1 hypothetical protein [Patescibacteria group bacterium]MBU0880266.1 hypothetical protein [Patescibacteria group bacterium]MBU0897889.1 hypothetical protein [Patescibacteria group bacterium]MBU1062967.1 hypothetical protein [Patescibacteria group bacterium]